jgi:hypothetical protein
MHACSLLPLLGTRTAHYWAGLSFVVRSTFDQLTFASPKDTTVGSTVVPNIPLFTFAVVLVRSTCFRFAIRSIRFLTIALCFQ